MNNLSSAWHGPEPDMGWIDTDGSASPQDPVASRPLDVVADDREQASGVVEYLQAQDTLCVSVRRLTLGDYLVGNRVLIERKTVADFSTSIVDGRLFRQACRLAASSYRPLLLIEGHVSVEADAIGVSRSAIQGAITTLAIFLNIPCLRAFDAQESANLIRYAAAQLQRDVRQNVCRHGYRPKGRRKRQLFVLQGLPGIGAARAAQLLDTFGSIENVCQADAHALAQVEGIGRKTAEAIRSLVGAEKCGKNPSSSESVGSRRLHSEGNVL